MKRFFSLILISAFLFAPGYAAGQIDSIFGDNSSDSSEEKADDFDLRELLSDFNVVEDGAEAAFVKLEVERNDITYPVYVYLTDSKQLLWFKIGLDNVPAPAADHVDKLLNLLSLSGSMGPAFYSYEGENRLTSLYSSMDPGEVTRKKLKTRVDNMIYQVSEQSDAWDTSTWTAPRHAGTWTARLDADTTMVINLAADGSFSLANKSGSGETSISGAYMLENGNLKMKDTDGNEVSGPLSFIDGNHFSLEINGRSMNFERR